MPHADSSLVPEDIETKPAFYAHVQSQLLSLLEGHRYWVSNLSQVASLLYHSYACSPLYGSVENTPVVNWCGFYIIPPGTPYPTDVSATSSSPPKLVLGPYHGRPACISINPIAGRGVCADAFVGNKGVVVPDVDAYSGHIACDGDTKSEIVLPLRIKDKSGQTLVIGVLDLDSTVLSTFDESDLRGLEGVTSILTESLDWT